MPDKSDQSRPLFPALWKLLGSEGRGRVNRFFSVNRGAGSRTGLAALIVALGRAGVAVGQIVLVRVSTGFLSPAQMGSVAQLLSFASLFSVVTVLPVGHYITRGFLEWRDAGRLPVILKRYLAYVLLAAAAAAVISGGIQVQWELVSGFAPLAVALLVFLYIISSPVSAFGTTGLNLMNRRLEFAVTANLPIWTGLLLSPLLFVRFGTAESWSLGQYLGFSVACVSFWALMRRLKDPSVAPHPGVRTLPFTKAAVFAFGWPIMVTAALWWIQSQSYKFVLEKIQGAGNLGLFVVGYSLAASPIGMYEALFAQFYEPIFYSELKGQGTEGQARAWDNYARRYLPGLLVVGVYVAFGAPYLARVLLGEAYRGVAMQVASGAVIIEIMRAAGAMMYHLGMAKVDQRPTILPVAAGAVLAPLGVLFLGRLSPVLGTLCGLFIAGLVSLMIVVVSSRRELPVSWPFLRILLGLALSLPLAAVFFAANWAMPSPGLALALLMLCIGGIYVLAVEIMLFRAAGDAAAS